MDPRSGSTFDIICVDELTKAQKKIMKTSSEAMPLLTAHGEIDAGRTVQVNIPTIGTTAEALVLDNTPCGLSLGRNCMDEGYGFHWEPGQSPQLINPLEQ